MHKMHKSPGLLHRTTTQTNPDNTEQLQVYTEGLLSIVSGVPSTIYTDLPGIIHIRHR